MMMGVVLDALCCRKDARYRRRCYDYDLVAFLGLPIHSSFCAVKSVTVILYQS